MWTGMVSGVQLRSKAHAGRIVLPGWALLNQTGVTGKYDVSGTAMMYSDDGESRASISPLVAFCGFYQHDRVYMDAFPWAQAAWLCEQTVGAGR